MKKTRMTDQAFEKMIEGIAPDLKAMRTNNPSVTPATVEKLLKELDEIHPFLRVLTKVQMRKLCLELFKERPMDGTDLAALLRKNNVKLKDATGEGEIYGLLQQLENAKAIESEWKDGIERQKKIYKLTVSGRAELQRSSSEESALAHAMLARAAS